MGFYRAQRQRQGLGRLRMGKFRPQTKQDGGPLFRRQGGRGLYQIQLQAGIGGETGFVRRRMRFPASTAAASRACARGICARRCRTARAGRAGPDRSGRYAPRQRQRLPAPDRRHRPHCRTAAAERRARPAGASGPDARRRRPNRPWRVCARAGSALSCVTVCPCHPGGQPRAA